MLRRPRAPSIAGSWRGRTPKAHSRVSSEANFSRESVFTLAWSPGLYTNPSALLDWQQASFGTHSKAWSAAFCSCNSVDRRGPGAGASLSSSTGPSGTPMFASSSWPKTWPRSKSRRKMAASERIGPISKRWFSMELRSRVSMLTRAWAKELSSCGRCCSLALCISTSFASRARAPEDWLRRGARRALGTGGALQCATSRSRSRRGSSGCRSSCAPTDPTGPKDIPAPVGKPAASIRRAQGPAA
mmetsp:Transcript_47714/g.98934  ORF Transcript_47714/g.98934 Transcript_47714/m.98934 type:complete len:244 (+) Transcript_47714:160-891(+)